MTSRSVRGAGRGCTCPVQGPKETSCFPAGSHRIDLCISTEILEGSDLAACRESLELAVCRRAAFCPAPATHPRPSPGSPRSTMSGVSLLDGVCVARFPACIDRVTLPRHSRCAGGKAAHHRAAPNHQGPVLPHIPGLQLGPRCLERCDFGTGTGTGSGAEPVMLHLAVLDAGDWVARGGVPVARPGSGLLLQS